MNQNTPLNSGFHLKVESPSPKMFLELTSANIISENNY